MYWWTSNRSEVEKNGLTWNQLQMCLIDQRHLHHMPSLSLPAKPSYQEKQIQWSEGRVFISSVQFIYLSDISYCWMWEIWIPLESSYFKVSCRITLVPRGPHWFLLPEYQAHEGQGNPLKMCLCHSHNSCQGGKWKTNSVQRLNYLRFLWKEINHNLLVPGACSNGLGSRLQKPMKVNVQPCHLYLIPKSIRQEATLKTYLKK